MQTKCYRGCVLAVAAVGLGLVSGCVVEPNGAVHFQPIVVAPAPVVVGFLPASGKVGSKIMLQGSHFVGTTAVAFNGVSAVFQLLSANYIRATVPEGATTGPITVTNAGGGTASVKSFTVQ